VPFYHRYRRPLADGQTEQTTLPTFLYLPTLPHGRLAWRGRDLLFCETRACRAACLRALPSFCLAALAMVAISRCACGARADCRDAALQTAFRAYSSPAHVLFNARRHLNACGTVLVICAYRAGWRWFSALCAVPLAAYAICSAALLSVLELHACAAAVCLSALQRLHASFRHPPAFLATLTAPYNSSRLANGNAGGLLPWRFCFFFLLLLPGAYHHVRPGCPRGAA